MSTNFWDNPRTCDKIYLHWECRLSVSLSLIQSFYHCYWFYISRIDERKKLCMHIPNISNLGQRKHRSFKPPSVFPVTTEYSCHQSWYKQTRSWSNSNCATKDAANVNRGCLCYIHADGHRGKTCVFVYYERTFHYHYHRYDVTVLDNKEMISNSHL